MKIRQRNWYTNGKVTIEVTDTLVGTRIERKWGRPAPGGNTMQTVREAAEARYPGVTFDPALPQGWVDLVSQATGYDPRGYFVWIYPDGDVFGRPGPITPEGDVLLHDLEQML